MGKPVMSEAVVLEGASPHLVNMERTARKAYEIGSRTLGLLRTYSPAQIGRQHTLDAISERTALFTRRLRQSTPMGDASDVIALHTQRPSYGVRLESVSAPTDELDIPVEGGQITEAAMLVTARGGHTTEFAFRTLDKGTGDETPDYTVAETDIVAIDRETMTPYSFDDYSPNEQSSMQAILRRVMDETGGALDESSLISQRLPISRASLLRPVSSLALLGSETIFADDNLSPRREIIPAG